MPRSEAFARRGRRARLRPSLEGLEARLLMASDGKLDPTFGAGSGYVLTSIDPNSTTGLSNYTASVVEPDGSILVAGPVGASGSTFGVLHLASDGAIDTSFGEAGVAAVVLPAGIVAAGTTQLGLGREMVSMLLQPDGKIVVVGLGKTDTADPVTVVARFDADGLPDSTFGTAGAVTLDQGALDMTGPSTPYVALQPDGDIVVAGSVDPPNISSPQLFSPSQIVSARLTADGALDPTYGTGGVVTITDATATELAPPFPAGEVATGVAIQPDGQIVILANLRVYNLSIDIPELIRLDANGSRDTSLSQAGLVASGITVTYSNGLIIQPDGKILVLGYGPANPASNDPFPPILARLNAEGSLDRELSFGTETSSGILPLPTSLALEPNGKILLAGRDQFDLGSIPIGGHTFDAFQVTANLELDSSFGVDGVSVIAFSETKTLPPDDDPVIPQVVAVGADGQLFVVGSSLQDPLDYEVVARLTDPAVPGDFTGDGLSDPAIYIPSQGVFAIGDSSGKTAGEIVPFGVSGAGQTIPAPGDYYGTGRDDIAAYIPALGVYAIQDPSGKTAGRSILFGTAGTGQTIPAPGDYYHTGQDDVAVYLTQSGVFAIQDPTGQTSGKLVPFGIPGAGQSIPVPGDYFGTGQDDIAVYLPQSGVWAIQDPTGQTSGMFIQFGMPGIGNAIPAPGDYDGSGHTELAVYLPTLGVFMYRPADGGAQVIPFGVAGKGQTLPAPGDYDGSGLTELAGYVPAYGLLAYRPEDGSADVDRFFGIAGPGQTIPVTTVALSPFPGSESIPGFADAIKVAGILGEPDALDFLPTATAKKTKPGDPPTSA
jgi:uncharacterized delta-60 repeat protein